MSCVLRTTTAYGGNVPPNPPGTGLDPRVCGSPLQQHDRIAHADRPRCHDAAVEGHRAAELPDDPAEHAGILYLRVRIVRGHHTARPELCHGDHDRADLEAATGPLALSEPIDA